MTNPLDWISDGPMRSAGWTLVHFFWQGAAAAALLLAALRALPRSAAPARYRFAWWVFLVMMACPLSTLLIRPSVPEWIPPLKIAVSSHFQARAPLAANTRGASLSLPALPAVRTTLTAGAPEATAHPDRPPTDTWLYAFV